MENKITIADVLKLKPELNSCADIYPITTADGSTVYLEVYQNSDFGLEYALYNDTYDDIDSGVIDECNAESESDIAQLILKVLKEMDVQGITIAKLPYEENSKGDCVDSFQEKVYKRWEERVAELKKAIKEEKTECC